MRMTGFVVGGLLGAAAAMFFNRGNNKLSLATLGNAGARLDQFIDTARSRMMDPDRRSYYGGTTNSTMNASAGGTTNSTMNASSGSGLGKVQQIVNQDPQLSKQVGEILADSDAPNAATTTTSTIR
ncbi:hypothetical protein [Paenibacillus thermotolerans]|uniref:hypothetical protein n=1 Tax=Paenibacillus thermotolerans TaxID=3027807 RepID=UPI002367DC2E|nr:MULTISPECIES: hypothetical protein [unclassified Paenibacillus]